MVKRIHFPSIDSTNNWAKENFSELDLDELVLVTAEEQTAGRGLYDRPWVSPKGCNIYATFVFVMPEDGPEVEHLTHVLALTVVNILKPLGFELSIKWPNDLFIDGKKLGGILCETVAAPQGKGVVLGVGLNVNMPPEMLEDIDQPATSLLSESSKEWNLDDLLDTLSKQFSQDLRTYLEQGFGPFSEQLRNTLKTKN